MAAVVYVPFLVGVVLAVAAPTLTRRLAPGPRAWTLALASLAAAGASLASLGLLAWLFVAELPPIAALGRWRPAALASASPVPLPITAIALAVLGWLAWRLARRVLDVLGEASVVLRMERQLPSRRGPARLVIVEDPVPIAHALAGLPRCGGHIVVSTGVLDALDEAELRQAVYEHERSHLRHHHATIRLLTDLAVAVNPLLRGAHRQVDYLLERWADEDAAAATSRAITAEALATVALATVSLTTVAAARLAFHEVGVPARISALLEGGATGDRRRDPAVWSVLAGLLLVAAGAIIWGCHDTELLFENIRRWQPIRP